MNRLQKIIAEYIQEKEVNRTHLRSWEEHCRTRESDEEAIEAAALAVNDKGKKHSHQWRLRNETLTQFADALIRNRDELNGATSFDQLYKIIFARRVKGVAELAVYDTALRYGNRKGLYPEMVYLHRGALEGAEKLLGRRIKANSISRQDLPPDFQHPDLSCADIEAILCAYKNQLTEESPAQKTPKLC